MVICRLMTVINMFLHGDFEIHHINISRQFKLDRYEIVLSTDEEELLNIYQVPYLRNCGPTQAKYIVDAFRRKMRFL